MKKIIFGFSALLTISTLSLFAFDWPQNEILSDSFYSYFAQFRGGTIGTSLIFSESEEVIKVYWGIIRRTWEQI